MESNFIGPVNIGSEEMIKINDLVIMTSKIANKKIRIKNVQGPTGVRGRNSDNRLLKEKLGWAPEKSLLEGIQKTYSWINEKVLNDNGS